LSSSTLAVLALASTALHTVVYLRALDRVQRLATSPYTKASSVRRLGAACVDLALCVASVGLYGRLGTWAALLGGLYLVLRDSLHGRSLGKLLFGLMVVSLKTGRPAGLRESVARNFLFLVPPPVVAGAALELHTVASDPQGQRLGDRIAATQVVDGYGLRDLVAELQRGLVVPSPRSRARAPVADDAAHARA
jgi:uncharacterized RDD family membrane protein YckC